MPWALSVRPWGGHKHSRTCEQEMRDSIHTNSPRIQPPPAACLLAWECGKCKSCTSLDGAGIRPHTSCTSTSSSRSWGSFPDAARVLPLPPGPTSTNSCTDVPRRRVPRDGKPNSRISLICAWSCEANEQTRQADKGKGGKRAKERRDETRRDVTRRNRSTPKCLRAHLNSKNQRGMSSKVNLGLLQKKSVQRGSAQQHLAQRWLHLSIFSLRKHATIQTKSIARQRSELFCWM